MWKNYLTSTVRTIQRNKLFTFINIVGLSVGMAASLMIILWVWDEVSFDNFFENRNQLYRVMSYGTTYMVDGISGSPMVLGEHAVAELPEIEKAVTFEPVFQMLVRRQKEGFYFDKGIVSDPTFFDVLPFPLKSGHPDHLLENPHDIVISEEMGRKLFGAEDPTGQSIIIDDISMNITGVFSSIPGNSTLQLDFVAPYSLYKELGVGFIWGRFMGTTFLQLRPGTNPDIVAMKLTAVAKNARCPQVLDGVSFRLQPFADLHLDGKHNDWTIYKSGDSRYIWLFSVVVVLILLIACVNYINLTTARADKRAFEIGMRKVSGASPNNLSIQFFTESALFTTISLIVALFLLWIFWPYYLQLTGKELVMDLLTPMLLIGIAGVFILTTLLSGLYPSLVLPAFNPVAVLKGPPSSRRGKGWMRKGLVVFQFFITSALIIGSLIIFRQISYIRNMELGFNSENVICLPMKENLGEKYSVVKQQLLTDPNILSVTCSDYLWATENNRCKGCVSWEGIGEGDDVDLLLPRVDFDYFETLDIPLIAGRSFSKDFSTDSTEAFMINESAARAMNLDNPVGVKCKVSGSTGSAQEGRIIGVFKDIHYASLHQEIEPQFVRVYRHPEKGGQNATLLVRFQGNHPDAIISRLKGAWESVNQVTPFEYSFLDQTYENLYRKDRQIGRVVSLFTILAIILSALGIFGLTTFIAERRTREVAIRKVNGATARKVIWLITWDFTRLVVISFILAIPLAWIIMNKVLQSYAYHISITPWIILLALVIVLCIATLSSVSQAMRLSRMDPVRALKYE
ncbi:ABC transporter permease [Bacteroidota bacterium]